MHKREAVQVLLTFDWGLLMRIHEMCQYHLLERGLTKNCRRAAPVRLQQRWSTGRVLDMAALLVQHTIHENVQTEHARHQVTPASHVAITCLTGSMPLWKLSHNCCWLSSGSWLNVTRRSDSCSPFGNPARIWSDVAQNQMSVAIVSIVSQSENRPQDGMSIAYNQIKRGCDPRYMTPCMEISRCMTLETKSLPDEDVII